MSDNISAELAQIQGQYNRLKEDLHKKQRQKDDIERRLSVELRVINNEIERINLQLQELERKLGTALQ